MSRGISWRRAALPELLRTGGNIIFSCSLASYRAVDDGALYVSTKHANLGIVRGLAWEFAPHVRVNGVAIGVARTRMEGLAHLDQQPIDAVLPGAEEVIPLGFIPEPADYAAAFTYLASDAAKIVTGECLWADSGSVFEVSEALQADDICPPRTSRYDTDGDCAVPPVDTAQSPSVPRGQEEGE